MIWRYTKPQFDSDKIYQLIAEIVEKTFIPEQEGEDEDGEIPSLKPYVRNVNKYNYRYKLCFLFIHNTNASRK